jgi:hypothetical protein
MIFTKKFRKYQLSKNSYIFTRLNKIEIHYAIENSGWKLEDE